MLRRCLTQGTQPPAGGLISGFLHQRVAVFRHDGGAFGQGDQISPFRTGLSQERQDNAECLRLNGTGGVLQIGQPHGDVLFVAFSDTGYFTRATTQTAMFSAPAFFRHDAAAERLAPVVRTSSTSNTDFPFRLTPLIRLMANAPARLRCR